MGGNDLRDHLVGAGGKPGRHVKAERLHWQVRGSIQN
jgi:hypothetical protein